MWLTLEESLLAQLMFLAQILTIMLQKLLIRSDARFSGTEFIPQMILVFGEILGNTVLFLKRSDVKSVIMRTTVNGNLQIRAATVFLIIMTAFRLTFRNSLSFILHLFRQSISTARPHLRLQFQLPVSNSVKHSILHLNSVDSLV